MNALTKMLMGHLHTFPFRKEKQSLAVCCKQKVKAACRWNSEKYNKIMTETFTSLTDCNEQI